MILKNKKGRKTKNVIKQKMLQNKYCRRIKKVKTEYRYFNQRLFYGTK